MLDVDKHNVHCCDRNLRHRLFVNSSKRCKQFNECVHLERNMVVENGVFQFQTMYPAPPTVLQQAPALNQCTFSKTGAAHQPQYYKHCYDCFTNESEGACLNCAAVCHDGHRLSEVRFAQSFFCDCGQRGCRLASASPWPWKGQPHPSPRHPSPWQYPPPTLQAAFRSPVTREVAGTYCMFTNSSD